MSLKEQLQSDLTEAMRAKDETRRSTLRMVLTAVTNEEVAGAQARQLSDQEVLKVLARELKKRKEAANAYEDGHADRAASEMSEAEVIQGYLPAQIDDEELTTIVAEAIKESAASGPRAMGQIMKAVQPRIAGRAEGSRVAAEVKRQLAAD